MNKQAWPIDFLCVELFLYLQKQEAMEQAIIHKLQDFFRIQPIEKAWVFGSYSRGEKTKDKTRLLHILEAISNLFEFAQKSTFEESISNKK